MKKITPSVIFSLEFFQDYNVGENDFLDYMSRPEAFDESKHQTDEYKDFLCYMKNEEKSDGLFDIRSDLLSAEQIEQYRELEISSHAQGCPKYVGVMSFTNEFLEEVGIITSKGLNTDRLKEVARSGMSEMIHTSDKLSEDNIYWTAAIHTNTDNVHIHYSILEYEKRERAKDMLEVKAFDKLKSKVVNKLLGDEKIKALTELARQSLLPDLKREICSGHVAIAKLARQLPSNQTWQYGRDSFAPYRESVDTCVRSIVSSSPTLRKSFKQYSDELDSYEEKLAGMYGVGERQLYKDFKKNKLEDFYNRAGNLLLAEMKSGSLQEKIFESKRPPTEKENYSDKLSQSQNPSRHGHSSGGSLHDYLHSKAGLAKTLEVQVGRLSRQYENHVDRLKCQFDYEQERQLGR